MNIAVQLVLNSIIAGSIYSLVAVSFNLIYGPTKFFNLAHGTTALVAGYVAWYFGRDLGLNIYFATALGLLASGCAGFALDRFVYFPLRKKKASSMILLVASLGTFTILQAVIAMLFTSQFKTLARTENAEKLYKIFGGMITQTQVIIFMVSFIVMIGLVLFLKYTTFGKAVKAISDDEEVAKIVGINTDKIISKVFFIGSLVAGMAGVATGFDSGFEPTVGLSLLLRGIIAAIIGGIGSIYGGFIGAFLLGFVINFGIWKIPAQWQEAIAFLLLIIFLIFRPRGIMKK